MTPLRQRILEDMQVRNLSPLTQTSYVQQVSLFARHFKKSPEVLGPDEIRSYQVYLTNEKKLAPASVLIAVAALRFLYKVTLHKDWSVEDIIPALNWGGHDVRRVNPRPRTAHLNDMPGSRNPGKVCDSSATKNTGASINRRAKNHVSPLSHRSA